MNRYDQKRQHVEDAKRALVEALHALEHYCEKDKLAVALYETSLALLHMSKADPEQVEANKVYRALVHYRGHGQNDAATGGYGTGERDRRIGSEKERSTLDSQSEVERS